jgi:hypothetical protein
MPVTRRGVRIALGGFWILDGLLQLQPSMFTSDFPSQVLAPTGDGQPWFVARPVELSAGLIAAHPLAWDLAFAAVQVALGVGLLVPRLVRGAVVGSVLWSLGVWWLGEGLGGLAGGHADILTGAPGAVLLYAVLAAAVWPRAGVRRGAADALPGWLAAAWAVFWVAGALLRLLPGQGTSASIAAEISAGIDGAPPWLGHVQQSVAGAVADQGPGLVVAWVLVCLAVGLGGLARGWPRVAAATAGAVCAVLFWVLGQSLGEPWSGLATDPNTGPLIVLMAVALVGIGDPAAARGRHRRRSHVAGHARRRQVDHLPSQPLPVPEHTWRAVPALAELPPAAAPLGRHDEPADRELVDSVPASHTW